MGPVITAASRDRIVSLIGQGAGEGAKPIVDGRGHSNEQRGTFVGPTVLDGLLRHQPSDGNRNLRPCALRRSRRFCRRGH